MQPTLIDYETFYIKNEYSVRDLGNWRYTHDDRFDPYLMSVYDGEESWTGHPKDFPWESLRGRLLLAHNAAFDSSVTARLVELGQAPAFLLENQWQCTANMCAYLASVRSLQASVKTLEGRRLDKGVRDDMNRKNWNDIKQAGMAQAVADYALSDSREAFGLWQKYSHIWPAHEQKLSSLTMQQCARGVAINTDLLQEYTSILQDVIFNLERSMPWTKRGKAPTSPIAIAEECRSCGIRCPPKKTDDEEGFIAWEDTYKAKYPWVQSAGHWRSLRKLLSSLETIKERLRPDGTIDFSMLYFGAHTGRWSGGGSGLNLFNLRKIPLFLKDKSLVTPPDNLNKKQFAEWVAACTDYALDVRKLFIPRAGKKFILCDKAQIEPRVLAYLSGNTEFLAAVAKGMSPYEVHGRQVMGWTGGVMKDEDPGMYALAKVQVLQLGYQCAWEKFQSIAATDYNVILTDDESKAAVKQFRDGNKKITDLWTRLEDQFRNAARNKEHFVIELPSGRKMTYRDVARIAKLKKDDEGKIYTSRAYTARVGDKRVESYGGKLCENAVQAVARDVFAEDLLTLDRNKIDVVWHVYDEAVTEVDKDVKPRDVEHLMSTTPEWMPGLPVAAEAKEAAHYLK